MTHITDELRAFIGREVSYTAPEELGRASIRLFAIACEDDNPLYQDGAVAPPTLVCETNQFYRRRADGTGYFGHSWDFPPPLAGRNFMRGGNEYEFHQPVRPDDRVTVTWRVADITERETKAGGTLIFVVSEARYVNQRGELLAVNRETTVHRP